MAAATGAQAQALIPMQRERTAFHEAGHVVIIYRFGIEVEFVTILPDHDSVGHATTSRIDLFCGSLGFCAKLERAIKINLAGPMAEALFYPRYRRRLGSFDYVRAFELARYLAGGRAKEIIRHQERETQKLLKFYWKDVEHIARALLEHNELTGIAVKDILGPRQETEEEKEMDRIEAIAPEEPDPL
jgi:ATP-dependent Zn protease